MAKYMRFHPDLWTVVFNYEAIGVVTTLEGDEIPNHLENESPLAMKVSGHFRTQADYVGLAFSSQDKWMHSYYKYETNYNYKDVKLSFSCDYSGQVAEYDDLEQQPSCIMTVKNNEEYFVTVGFHGVKHTGSHSFLFEGEIDLPDTWIDMDSINLTWSHEGVQGTAEAGKDYDLDYVRGTLFTVEGKIPYLAECTLTYTYNTHEKYVMDFNNLYEGVHPRLRRNLDPEFIEKVTFPVIPPYFKEGDLIMTGRSDKFSLVFKDISVEGGELNSIPSNRKPHKYRIAEGFDDEYNKNPKRLIESTRALGYTKIINLYIGASHFYDKWGTAGVKSTGISSMYLDKEAGINIAFKDWYESYLKHMALNDFDDIVVSVSMECLQMPEEWKQLLPSGQAGATGWNPPTNFYSPNNDEVKVYIDKISTEILDVTVEKGFKPILQLGESWYWFQEFQPGNVQAPYKGKPPAFYDKGTLDRYKKEVGKDLPVYHSSEINYTPEDQAVSDKMRQYLGEYTYFMKEISDKYDDSQFTTLFFPPSVLDEERTPVLIRNVNSPFEYWDNKQLSFIQIEDYDWVVHENPQHLLTYTQAWYDMGYSFQQQHYFAGFVWEEFNRPTMDQWKSVEDAGAGALGRGFLEVFIWAGTQIRRDSWTPKERYYLSDCEDFNSINMKQYT